MELTDKPINNYSDLVRKYSWKLRIKTRMRNIAVFILSVNARVKSSKEWVRVLFYHHIFDDERKGFERQLRFFKNHADFISMDNAVEIFENNLTIDGRYFCISFDDGLKNCSTNALPILFEHKCPAIFYIPANLVENITPSIPYQGIVEYMTYDDCRKLIDNGMAIGSHTVSHTPLNMLNESDLKAELVDSKKIIEAKLQVDCKHFAPPWGKPGKHFNPKICKKLTKEIGYKSLATTERGLNFRGADTYNIKRDHMIAAWEDYQLRYFL